MTRISNVPTKLMVRSAYLVSLPSNDLLKMGAKPTTITGLSGTGDIMLTCFVNLSRNRTVGVRLGSGEKLENILSSMSQVSKKFPRASDHSKISSMWHSF